MSTRRVASLMIRSLLTKHMQKLIVIRNLVSQVTAWQKT